jgi:hypothetical protein
MWPADKARYLGWPHPEERVPIPTMPLLGRVRVANRSAEAPGTSALHYARDLSIALERQRRQRADAMANLSQVAL